MITRQSAKSMIRSGVVVNKDYINSLKNADDVVDQIFNEFEQHINSLESQLSSNPLQLTCEWNMDEPDWNTYKTGCGKYFNLVEGDLKDNEFNNCPYCGGKITLKDTK